MCWDNYPPDSFTSLQLGPLSREAVKKLAKAKGYKGEDVYHISGGNPFYVNEILASYSEGIPDNIKRFNSFSIQPSGRKDKTIGNYYQSFLPFEIKYLEKLEPFYAADDICLGPKILIEEWQIFFKHELFRRTIEASLSPLAEWP